MTDDGDTIAELITLYKDELRVQTQSDGIGKLGNRRYKVNFATRYDFPSGWLKGVYIWGGYRHQSKMYTGLDAAMNKVYTNSFWNADAMVGYKVQGLRKGRNLSFQLNIYNVFNKRDPLVTRLESDGVTVFREVVQSPTTWKFTTSFEY